MYDRRASQPPSDKGWGSNELLRITTAAGSVRGPVYLKCRRACAALLGPRYKAEGEMCEPYDSACCYETDREKEAGCAPHLRCLPAEAGFRCAAPSDASERSYTCPRLYEPYLA